MYEANCVVSTEQTSEEYALVLNCITRYVVLLVSSGLVHGVPITTSYAGQEICELQLEVNRDNEGISLLRFWRKVSFSYMRSFGGWRAVTAWYRRCIVVRITERDR